MLVRECKTAIYNYECQRKARIVESQNTGAFYKFVNQKLHNSGTSSVLQNSSGSCIFNDYDKAELFNSYFNSVNVDDDGNLPTFPRRTESKIDVVQFTVFRRRLKTELYRRSLGPRHSV